MSALLVLAPLRVEALALRAGLPAGAGVLRTGMGRARALEAVPRVKERRPDAVVVAGVCGAVDPSLQPGDVVVATELLDEAGHVKDCGGAATLAHALSARGLHVHLGPVTSLPRLAGPDERRALRGSSLAVDMESAWLAGANGDRPFAVARVVVDTADRGLRDPRSLVAGVRALGVLRRVGPGLAGWASATGSRTVLLAGPRSFCAGVDRAIEIVEAVARESDLVLVVGSANSSNSVRLVEVARREGTDAYLIDDERDLDPTWLAGARTIGLTAGASAPERLVAGVIDELAGLGPVTVEERTMTTESIQFNLPREVDATATEVSA